MITRDPMVQYFVSTRDQYQITGCFLNGELVTERARTSSQTVGVCADSPVEAFQGLLRAPLSAINTSDTISSAD